MTTMNQDEEKDQVQWWLFLNANPIGVDGGKEGGPSLEELESLPENVKQMLMSDETSSVIYITGKENQLADAQITEIARTLREICFGNLNPTDFRTLIEKRANLTPDAANKISATLTKELISPNYFQISQHYRRKNEKQNLKNTEDKGDKNGK